MLFVCQDQNLHRYYRIDYLFHRDLPVDQTKHRQILLENKGMVCIERNESISMLVMYASFKTTTIKNLLYESLIFSDLTVQRLIRVQETA